MGNKMGHTSASEPRGAIDSSSTDPTDSQILDDQAVRDILETDSNPLPDQPTGDSWVDPDETTLSRTLELKPGDLNETKSLEELAELAEGTDKPEVPEAVTMEQHDLSSELSTRPGKSNER